MHEWKRRQDGIRPGREAPSVGAAALRGWVATDPEAPRMPARRSPTQVMLRRLSTRPRARAAQARPTPAVWAAPRRPDGGVVDGAGVADGAACGRRTRRRPGRRRRRHRCSDCGCPITPGPTGLVLGSSNTLGVQGSWYSFSDGVGADGSTATGICEARGLHTAAQCSTVTTPAVGSFPNTGGKMCTSGKVAVVIVGTNALPDYANITGAGIGLDLNNSGGAVPVRGVFNATAKGVTGLAFDLDVVTLPGLRVEFPTPTTDGTSAGAAYWGANPSFANSPAGAGTNVIRWADVRIAGDRASGVRSDDDRVGAVSRADDRRRPPAHTASVSAICGC